MTTSDLGGPLLASVSRSFYLTIRLLPAPLRDPIGLAYLLARASDTIADSAQASVSVRFEALTAFNQMIRTGVTDSLPALQQAIHSEDKGESELIKKLGRCLQWLESLKKSDRDEIVRVMEIIIRGQRLDLQRFGETGQIIALQTAAELDEYTYLVAGCVGEFWTRLCLLHLPRYSTIETETLCRIGLNFGKGLQLVNILRDMPADLRAGRCYLPEDELRAAGLSPESLVNAPQSAHPVIERWLIQAGDYLQDGHRYIASLNSGRLRAACFLPWYLGLKTLRLMREQPPLETGRKVKVPRSTVRKGLLLALPIAFSNRPLNALVRT
ncbi:MAG: Squalene/phytoene synthase [Chthoniobacteraceae bacterium]|nr:Squalene/phytoene synthase [Chthoniobacteraceae bacterium]